ncbi:hypothetical protein [Salinicola endophyticus]|uniref:Integron gene cassette protein n=1 Tax=Salinicola endophyticus TaxID=1949083 RepID=A0AB74UAR8_9GAMM
MNDSVAFGILLFTTIGVGALAFLLVIVGMILAPFIIDKVDRALGPLASEKELFFKRLPLSAHRMSVYGFKVLCRYTSWGERHIYRDHPDRVHAVESAPPWILNVVTWIYASFVIVAPIAILLAVIATRIHDAG